MHDNYKSKLASYSAFASAFLGIGKVSVAQIVCNDFNPDVVIDLLHPVGSIDLNNDGIMDLKFELNKSSTANTCSYCGGSSDVSVKVEYLHSYIYVAKVFNAARAFNEGDTIGSNLTWDGELTLFKYHTFWDQDTIIFDTIIGDWMGVNDKYMGFLQQLDYLNHYGWIRCSTDGGILGITVQVSAENPIGDSSIIAGMCSYPTNIYDQGIDIVRMAFSNNRLTLDVSDLQFENGEFRVYNIQGEVILEKHRIGSFNSFKFENNPSGLYYAFYRKNDEVHVYKFVKL